LQKHYIKYSFGEKRDIKDFGKLQATLAKFLSLIIILCLLGCIVVVIL